MDFRGEPQSLTKRQLSWDKFRCSWGYPIQITWVFMGRTPSYRKCFPFPTWRGSEINRSRDPRTGSDPPLPTVMKQPKAIIYRYLGREKTGRINGGGSRLSESIKSVLLLEKNPLTTFFLFPPSFFLRPTVKFRVWFGMMWPISQCRNNTDWPPEEGLHPLCHFLWPDHSGALRACKTLDQESSKKQPFKLNLHLYFVPKYDSGRKGSNFQYRFPRNNEDGESTFVIVQNLASMSQVWMAITTKPEVSWVYSALVSTQIYLEMYHLPCFTR